MRTNEHDRIMRTLASMSSPEPSTDRARRTRARCHAALARCRQRQRPLEQQRPVLSRFVDALFLIVLAVYLGGAVGEAVWLSAFF
jgi:hypothetical protein